MKMSNRAASVVAFFTALAIAPSIATADEPVLNLTLRSRVETPTRSGDFKPLTRKVQWDPRATTIIVCDMWDDHTCKGAARRAAEMAPAIDRTVKAGRKQGVFIVHAPSGRMSFYKDTPQRHRATEAPEAKAPVKIKWNDWSEEREGKPLADFVHGGCACKKPCANFRVDKDGIRHWIKGGKIPWTRQIKTIEIADQDAISDNGQEIYNLLEQRGIKNVILMGVHTNLCVCGRPFGLRQMTYLGKNVVLCRDLTDALFQSRSGEINQFRGTDLIIQHIENHICPTITSTSITGKPAFHFINAKANDTASAQRQPSR